MEENFKLNIKDKETFIKESNENYNLVLSKFKEILDDINSNNYILQPFSIGDYKVDNQLGYGTRAEQILEETGSFYEDTAYASFIDNNQTISIDCEILYSLKKGNNFDDPTIGTDDDFTFSIEKIKNITIIQNGSDEVEVIASGELLNICEEIIEKIVEITINI